MNLDSYCNDIRRVLDRTYGCPLCGLHPLTLSIDQSCDFGNFKVNGRHTSWRCWPCKVWVILQV